MNRYYVEKYDILSNSKVETTPSYPKLRSSNHSNYRSEYDVRISSQ